MVGRLLYGTADHEAQWFQTTFTGTEMDMRHVKLCLHTTETPGGWPSYAGGATAPTLTYDPWANRWRQHFHINRSARALQDPTATPVRENRADVVQVEISAYCDPARFGTGRGVNKLPDAAYDALGRFAAWLHLHWDMPLKAAPCWLPYPKSYGQTEARMSSPEWESYAGIVGHQHAPGNSHGDPGILAVDRILDRAHANLTRGGRVDRCIRLLTDMLEETPVSPRRRHLRVARHELRQIPPRLT